MAALLIGLTIMGVLLSAAMPVWSHYTRREKEEELIWRGQQYARAIGLFQRKYANTFPPSVDVLVEQRFLRKKYKDPITGEDFQPVPATGVPGGGIVVGGGGPVNGSGGLIRQATPPQPSSAGGTPRMTSVGTTGQVGGIGIQGVVSKSTETSIKIFNGRQKYNEWVFVYMAATQGIGTGGQPPPGGQRIGPGGTTFTPIDGSDRRPQPPGTMPGGGPPRQPPFGSQPPFGQPPPQQPPRPPGG